MAQIDASSPSQPISPSQPAALREGASEVIGVAVPTTPHPAHPNQIAHEEDDADNQSQVSKASYPFDSEYSTVVRESSCQDHTVGQTSEEASSSRPQSSKPKCHSEASVDANNSTDSTGCGAMKTPQSNNSALTRSETICTGISSQSGRFRKSKTAANFKKASMTKNFSEASVTDAQGRGFLANMMEGEGNQTPQFVNQIVNFVPEGVRNHIFARNSTVDKCSRRKKETWASRALRSLHFETARMMCSVLDLIVLAWNIHDAALYAEHNPHLIGSGVRDLPMFVIFNDAFALLYVVEVLLRLWIERLNFFRIAHPWRTYNFLMSIIFACQAITQHVAFNERGHSQARIWLTNLAMFRIFRLFQIIGQETEYLRYSSTFKELRCMVYSLGGAMWSLLWSSIIVFSLLLMFALFFCGSLHKLPCSALHC
jgi:hypothetical protein